jgi:transcription termination factor Rho
MYHIEQLRSKEIADLQSIAQELGIKGIKSLDRDSLIYRILDGQAMQNSKTGAPAVVKEENRMNRREHRRHRIHNDAPSKVYTATGEKAVKLDNNEPKKAVSETVAPAPQVQESKPVEVVAPQVTEIKVAEDKVTEKAPASKKRGRKPKATEKAVPAAETVVEATNTEEKLETPVVNESVKEKKEGASSKKRGRKPASK